MELLLHPETKQATLDCLSSDAHAFMLLGSSGSGKQAIAESLATQLLEVEKLDNQPGFKLLNPEKGSVGIDAVRSVQQFLRLKTTGQSRVRRVVIIINAQTMTIEAQNAFLKILEEPPEDTRIILTATDGHSMLPTIYSRVQTIAVQALSKETLTAHFTKNGNSATDIQKAYLLGGSHIGLMTALLTNQSDHPLLEYVDKAKIFLGQTPFERLAHLDTFAKNREEVALLLEALMRMSTSAFEQAALANKQAQAKHWHIIRSNVLRQESNLSHNPNVKLLLTDLSLNL